jgi:subtilisin family serine protease
MKLKLNAALLLLIGLVGCSSTETPALVQGETGSYVVLLNPGENGPAVAKEYEAKGAVVSAIYQNALQGFAGEFSGELLSELEADPRVKALEADSVIHLGNLNAQTMTGSWSQDKAPWGLDRIDQENLPLDGKYSYWPTGKGVNVYIVSSGISKTHQDIQGRVYSGRDFVGDGWGTNDCYGEGTASASIIGGKTFGVAGVLA